jgi:hypothetical protein
MTNLPKPSEREAEEITAATTRRIARRPRFAVSMELKGDKLSKIGPNHTNAAGWCDRALDTFGTPSPDFVATELDRLASVLGGREAASEGTLNTALAVLDGQKPASEIETQLLIQMCATHAVAMDFLARVKRATDIANVETCGKLANRLVRAYALQCDTLASLRRGGKQVVEVQHVYRKRKDARKGGEGWTKLSRPPKTGAAAAAELEEA